MKVCDFDYNLPKELIAQAPIEGRSGCNMMRLNKNGEIEHKKFYDFPNYLNSGDVLVLNDTKVIPARILGHKKTGAKIEIFLLKPIEGNVWEALIRNSKRLKEGDIVEVADVLSIKIIEKTSDTNKVELIYNNSKSIYEILDIVGKIPLPPYIEREADEKDKEIYQTVFAKNLGSVAAPTAGLHFTQEILDELKNKGVKIAYITLVVGLGTFLPVKCEEIKDHKMHFESFEITEETANIINSAQGKIVACGTTVVRTLEATHKKYGKILPIKDETNIFIYPPYEFKVVDKLLTNFHLPKSTLLMLVSAFSGKKNIMKAYENAVNNEYKFFSYGDCMLLDRIQGAQ